MFKDRVMVDIETLGVSNNATILSVGAVQFNLDGLGREFLLNVNFDNSRNIDADTIKWWMNQESAAKIALFSEAPFSLNQVMVEFNNFAKDSEIWGNGSDFDNVILADAFKQCGMKWNHRANRCYRTLKSFAPQIELKRIGTHHNALDDAKSQALHAIEILKHLGIK